MFFQIALLKYRLQHFWWRLHLDEPAMSTLFIGPHRLDKESRHIIYDRWEREHDAREPQPPTQQSRRTPQTLS